MRDIDVPIAKLRLLYWPIEVNGSTKPQSNAVLRTAVFDDHTLTSPYVYVSYPTSSAFDSCGLVGKTYHDVLITLTDSAILSSFWKSLVPEFNTLDSFTLQSPVTFTKKFYAVVFV